MSKENWLEKSRVAIDQIYTEEPNEQNTLLLGALLAVVDHGEIPVINISTVFETPIQPISALPVNKSLLEFVDDELSDAEMYYGMGEFDIARDELRHANRFLSVLKAKGDKDNLNEFVLRRDAIAARLC